MLTGGGAKVQVCDQEKVKHRTRLDSRVAPEVSRERGADWGGVAAGLASRLIKSNTAATGGASGALWLRLWCTACAGAAAAVLGPALELHQQIEAPSKSGVDQRITQANKRQGQVALWP